LSAFIYKIFYNKEAAFGQRNFARFLRCASYPKFSNARNKVIYLLPQRDKKIILKITSLYADDFKF
jgi:hypothetical protein